MPTLKDILAGRVPWWWRLVWAVVLLLGVGVATYLGKKFEWDRWSEDQFLRAFEQAAFYRTDVIIRWHGPLDVRVNGDNRDILRYEIQRELDKIASFIGVTVRTDAVTASEGGNFLIEIVLGSLRPEEPDRCTTQLRVRDGHIQEARLLLRPSQVGLRPCLLRELMHAFGFQGLVDPRPSVLANPAGRRRGPPKDQLTVNDELLLRALYDRRLEIGEPRPSALTKLQGEILPSLIAPR